MFLCAILPICHYTDRVAPVTLGPEPGELPGPEHGEDGQHQDHHEVLPGQGAGHLCRYVDMSRYA